MDKRIIALTGSMGSGKSQASNIFFKRGVKIISTDILAKRVLVEDMQVRPKFVEILGEECFSQDGTPLIKEIAGVIFADKEKLSALESIVHPRTRALWMQQTKNYDGLVVVEIPLLFEKKLEKYFDICATVFCSEHIRFSRLAKRSLTLAEIKERDAFQLPSLEKVNRADVVFFNDGNYAFLEDQITIFLNKLNGRRK